MYTKEDYIAEKNEMPKQERMIQERFEQLIEVLVMYKQENREEDVYLTDKSLIGMKIPSPNTCLRMLYS